MYLLMSAFGYLDNVQRNLSRFTMHGASVFITSKVIRHVINVLFGSYDLYSLISSLAVFTISIFMKITLFYVKCIFLFNFLVEVH